MLLVAKENPVREGPRKATENDMALGTLRRARHPTGGVMGSGARMAAFGPERRSAATQRYFRCWEQTGSAGVRWKSRG